MNSQTLESKSPLSTPEGKEGSGLRVLVADDQDNILVMSRRVLELMGYEVDVVKSGKALFDKLTKEGGNYDVVISDNNMPGEMDGIEVLRRIRKNPNLLNLPFIINSGLGDDQLLEETRELGAAFIAKPWKMAEYSSLVKKTYLESKQ